MKRVGFVDTNNSVAVSKKSGNASKVVNNAYVHDNKYMDAILCAIKDFIEEEVAGQLSTEARLNKKIMAARMLFAKEKREMIKANSRFGF